MFNKTKKLFQNNIILSPFFDFTIFKLKIQELLLEMGNFDTFIIYGSKGKGKSSLLRNIYINQDIYFHKKVPMSFLTSGERIVAFKDKIVFDCIESLISIDSSYNEINISLSREISIMINKFNIPSYFNKKYNLTSKIAPNNSHELLSLLYNIFTKININPNIMLKKYTELSFGEQNIIKILSICFNQSQMILLDEILNSIDYATLELLVPIIQDFTSSIPKKIFLSTHKIEIAQLFQSKKTQYIYFDTHNIKTFSNFLHFIQTYKSTIKHEFSEYYKNVEYIINNIIKNHDNKQK